ncbi:MAG: molybdopterin-dependent oxidoreductase [Thermodesulfovibrionales bacterium]
MNITRRDFLKWTGAAGLSTMLAPILDRDMKAFAEIPPGEGYFFPTESRYTMCTTCDGNCGLIMRVVDVAGKKVVREINGNPADKLGSMGKNCVKSQSAIRNIYDPDVLKYPMMRTNQKKGINEDPGFVIISWPQALETIAEKMRDAKLAEGCGPRSIVCLERPNEMGRYLVDPLGTPNQVCHVDTCYLDQDVAWYVTFKKGKSRTFEMEKSTYILSFGYDLPGKSKIPQLNSFLTAWRNGAKVVVFDPRLSVTANFADEWFQIKPGTDLAVVLAMIYVVINEDLYDHEYVTNYCYGFNELKSHVINSKKYTPEWAEGISGIPAADISRIAREFATAEHPLIPTYKRDPAGPVYANSSPLNRAIITLNALVGAYESEGGYWWPRTPSTPPPLKGFGGTTAEFPPVDGQIRVDGQHMFPCANTMFGTSGGQGYKSKGNFSHLAEGLERARTGAKFPDGKDSYPVKVIFSGHYNVNSFPYKDHLIEELCNPDIFIAATDNVLSNMCWLADIVLPTTWFPHDMDTFGTTDQHEIRGRFFLRDGVPPPFEKRGVGKIYFELHKKLRAVGYWGDPEDPNTPNYAVDVGALNKERMRQFGIAKGLIPSTGTWEDMKNWLIANGGLWIDPNPPTPNLNLGTPSGKIELYSQKLEHEGHEPLPTWHPKLAEPRAADEFYLVTNHNAYHRMNKNSNDPLIMDLQPENFLYIHPDVASSFGVTTGDYVYVKNEITDITLKMRVKVIKGIRPDTVMTEHGYGHFSKGLSVAYGKGVYDGDIEPDRTLADSLSRYAYNPGMASAIGDTVVKILRKA